MSTDLHLQYVHLKAALQFVNAHICTVAPTSVEDLESIEREYGKVEFSIDALSFTIKDLPSIKLQDPNDSSISVDLGLMDIVLEGLYNTYSNEFMFRELLIRFQNPVYSLYQDSRYPHPYCWDPGSDGRARLCLGSKNSLVHEQIRTGRLLEAIDIIYTVLKFPEVSPETVIMPGEGENVNAFHGHAPVSTWFRMECNSCHAEVDEDYMYMCEMCRGMFCIDCFDNEQDICIACYEREQENKHNDYWDDYDDEPEEDNIDDDSDDNDPRPEEEDASTGWKE